MLLIIKLAKYLKQYDKTNWPIWFIIIIYGFLFRYIYRIYFYFSKIFVLTLFHISSFANVSFDQNRPTHINTIKFCITMLCMLFHTTHVHWWGSQRSDTNLIEFDIKKVHVSEKYEVIKLSQMSEIIKFENKIYIVFLIAIRVGNSFQNVML
jgi:hypothetical protein